MAIKTYKPTTPSRRHMTVSAFEGIDKKAKPERALTEVLKKHAGRNSYGRITVRHHGGGNKQKYRIIDFKRDKEGKATVVNLQYDPNRSANIALIEYEDGERRYILAPNGLKAGHIIMTGPDADILPAQETAPAMLVALNSGACDVVVTDRPTAQAALVAYPDFVALDFGGGDKDFQVSDEDINIGISMKKGNTALKDAINQVLATMTTDDYNTMMDEAISVQPLSE